MGAKQAKEEAERLRQVIQLHCLIPVALPMYCVVAVTIYLKSVYRSNVVIRTMVSFKLLLKLAISGDCGLQKAVLVVLSRYVLTVPCLYTA
jgi:hypothetical protein